ncbi:MAG: hypothetical protein JWO32_1482 [Bacteroidetes bacterium]|nr:hypothetical protein [Bacteroidota bacterium]
MKKIALIFAMIASLATVSMAQQVSPTGNPKNKQNKSSLTPAERAKKSAHRAEKELGLNADQKAKWEAATLERINANAPFHEKMKGATTPEERKSIHAQAKTNIDKFDATVTAFLTPEQKTKFDAQKEKMKQARKEHHKGAKGEAQKIDDED